MNWINCLISCFMITMDKLPKHMIYNRKFVYNLLRNTPIIHNYAIWGGFQVLTVAVEEAMK